MVLNESKFSFTGSSGVIKYGNGKFGFIKDVKFLDKIVTFSFWLNPTLWSQF
jgi:hypothetical protein